MYKNIIIAVIVIIVGWLIYQKGVDSNKYMDNEKEYKTKIANLKSDYSDIQNSLSLAMYKVDSLESDKNILVDSIKSLQHDKKQLSNEVNKYTSAQSQYFYNDRYLNKGNTNEIVVITNTQAKENIIEVKERDILIKEVSVLEQKSIICENQNNIKDEIIGDLNDAIKISNVKLRQEYSKNKDLKEDNIDLKQKNKTWKIISAVGVGVAILLAL